MDLKLISQIRSAFEELPDFRKQGNNQNSVHDKNAISLKIRQNIRFVMNKATECTRSANYRSD